MTLDQLKIFVTVADLQHVTRAATALHLTQSAVSNAISTLEARHNVALFHRIGRRIELTSEGAIFLKAARSVLAQARNAEELLADLGNMRRGLLTLFASQTIANFWLPERLDRYNTLFPDVDLDLRIGNTAESVAAVCEGTAELGLVEGHASEAGLAVELVATDHLVVVVGAGHAWTRTPPDLPAALASTRWALREEGSGTRSSFESALARSGMSLNDLSVAMELPSNEALCAVAAAGNLATVVSSSVASAAVQTGRLRIIPFDLGTRDFRVIRHRERTLSRAAQAFLTVLT